MRPIPLIAEPPHQCVCAHSEHVNSAVAHDLLGVLGINEVVDAANISRNHKHEVVV